MGGGRGVARNTMSKMVTFLFDKRLILVLRLGLGAIFLLAAGMKMRSPLALVKAIEAYRLLPKEMISWFAMSLLIFEGLTGMLLLSKWWRIGALSASLLLSIFLIVLFSALARGLSIECSCFGELTFLGVTPQAMLFRNALLLVLAFFCYVTRLEKD